MTYFGRAVALIEGLGTRHVPDFNPVRSLKPLLMKHRAAVLRALGPTDAGEAADLAYSLGLIAREIIDVSRGLFGVLSRRVPELLAVGVASSPLAAAEDDAA
jgi:hypothetical protein